MLRRERVAQLIVAGARGRYRGSGYLVTATSVLTAAHVLAGAESVRVVFEPDLAGEQRVDALSWWVDPVSDLAVVTIEARPVEAAGFGGIGGEAVVLSVQAVGFPLWKLREADGEFYRDSYHAVGTVAVLSNWREGTLEVAVDATPAGSWEGMSGAAVWAGDRIVGVLAKHHPADGPSRLAAIRLDRALAGLDDERRAQLRELLGIDGLPDVVPPAPSRQVPAAYRAQLADIAPDELVGREDELAELVRFCAGSEFYAWWQAEAEVRAMPDGPQQDEQLELLAKATADLGEYDRAERLAAGFVPFAVDVVRRRQFATALAAGDYERAVAVAEAITTPLDRIHACAHVVIAEPGHVDLEQLVASAAELTTPADRIAALPPLAAALAASGEHGGARELIDRAESLVRDADPAVGHVTDLAALAKVAATIDDHSLRNRLLDLAESVTAAGPTPDEYIYEIHKLNHHDAMSAIGEASVETGDYQRIRRLIADLPAEYLRDSLTVVLVRALAQDGQFADATGLISTINDPERTARAWLAVAEAGSLHADAVAAAIRDSALLRDELRGALAGAVARAGDHAHALRLIDEITEPKVRALTLDAITEQFPDPGYRRLVADTLSTEEWLRVLPAVARLDPRALREFCDQLL